MKRKFSHFSLLASVGLLAFGVGALSACNSGANFVAASVKVDKQEVAIGVGDSVQLKASHTKGYSGEVRWFSSNESVAYVNGAGRVFGVGEGEAIITVAFGGGFADCKVVVSGEGGGEVVTQPKVSISPNRKEVNLGDIVNLTASVYPEETTITEWRSSDPSKATVEGSGLAAVVTTLAAGSVTITATGSNNKSGTCVITIRGGSEGGEVDIAVGSNLNYSGSMIVGAPSDQKDFMKSMLDDFNRLTSSNISFTVTTFEEDNGTSGYTKPSGMPAVFPYASDQTLALTQFQALANVGTNDRKWIKEVMGEDALNAAKLGSVVGYPFASDNGVVMFYDKAKVSDPSQIDTMDKLIALAKANDDWEINYAVATGFYAAGALMSYPKAGGAEYYHLDPNDTSYTASSKFNCAEGIKAAEKIKEWDESGVLRPMSDAPKGDVLATITDVSKARFFKSDKGMGANYACTAVPWIHSKDSADPSYDANYPNGVRLGTFLGYKFFGVNASLADKTQASAVAKYLCSKYVQEQRFNEFGVRPTLTSLQEMAKSEPHVAALVEQSKNNGTIPLTAFPSEVWSAASTAVTDIKTAAAPNYTSILDALDKTLTKK